MGEGVGERVGWAVGEGVGEGVGWTVGEGVGGGVGWAVGEGVGEGVGWAVGEGVGEGLNPGTALLKASSLALQSARDEGISLKQYHRPPVAMCPLQSNVKE